MARCRRRTGLPLLGTLVLSHLCLAPRPAAAQLVEEGRNDEPPVAAIIPFGAKVALIAPSYYASGDAQPNTSGGERFPVEPIY